MIRGLKGYNFKIVFFILSLLFLFINIAYALRIPYFSQDPESNERTDQLLQVVYGVELPHRIIVYRNNVVDINRKKLLKCQVTMRVCEISELSREERFIVTKIFNRWLTDYPGLNRNGVVHQGTIKIIINMLGLSNSALQRFSKSNRIYLSLSDPKVNGRREIDVEGFIWVVDRSYKNKYPAVVCWEIKPDNRDVALERWYMPKWLPTPTPKHKFRFFGIGRQLLCYAVWREVNRGCDILVFKVYGVDDNLRSEGLYARIPYSSSELIQFIRRRNWKTIEYLKEAVRSNDRGAKEILGDLLVHFRGNDKTL